MSAWKIVAALLSLSIVVGCSSKPIAGEDGQDNPFDATIVAEKSTKAAVKVRTLDWVSFAGEGMTVQVSDNKGSAIYHIATKKNNPLRLIKESRMEGPWLSIKRDENLRNTTDIFEADGYLKGRYYVKKIKDTKSTLRFEEAGYEAHLDLLEIAHEAQERVAFVHVDDGLRRVYYEIFDDKDRRVAAYTHLLATNETLAISPETAIGALNPATGEMVYYSQEVKGGLLESVTGQSEASNGQTEGTPKQESTTERAEETTEHAGKDHENTSKASAPYDVVIANGIVMDPATNTIKVGYDIGVVGDEIVAISDDDLEGATKIDATGRIVAPGFIDMLGFNLTRTVSKYKITDGVTTNLSLHGCTEDFDSFFATYENRSPQYVNFGGAVYMIRLRQEAGLGWHRGIPTKEQIDYMARRTKEEIESGAVAVAFSPEYYPATTAEEIKAVMAVAAQYDVPTHFHLRYSSITGEDIGIKGVEEVIGYARETGGRVQIMHLHSTGGTGMMDEALGLVEDARAEGLQITYDIYPYDSWASRLSMARFRKGWQERYGIDYEDLVIAGTGEQVTKENFKHFKKQGALAIAYAMDEEEMLAALSRPYAQVGSDGNIESETAANNHFRGAGTFSRILGKYVRDEDVFSLMDGLKKMTINGARWLEPISKDMARRGRLQEGAIADITVFDYKSVLDRSTPEKPATTSLGIEHVLVGGKIGLRDGKLQTTVKAGVGIKSDFISK